MQEEKIYPLDSLSSPTNTDGLMRLGTIVNESKKKDFDSQQYRVYSPEGKSATLCGNGGGVGAKTGLYFVPLSEK